MFRGAVKNTKEKSVGSWQKLKYYEQFALWYLSIHFELQYKRINDGWFTVEKFNSLEYLKNKND